MPPKVALFVTTTSLPTNSANQLSEATLVARLRSRDTSAMAILYNMYSAALYGIILQIVKIEEVAEDVLQEAFVKIWHAFDSYQEDRGRLFTWMLNIARNLAIDKVRSKEYRVSKATVALSGSSQVSFVTNAQNPDHIGVREILDKLDPEQKQIIDLMYFEGLTQSEIAKEYNIPLGTVKTRARSAVKFLSRLFKGRA